MPCFSTSLEGLFLRAWCLALPAASPLRCAITAPSACHTSCHEEERAIKQPATSSPDLYASLTPLYSHPTRSHTWDPTHPHLRALMQRRRALTFSAPLPSLPPPICLLNNSWLSNFLRTAPGPGHRDLSPPPPRLSGGLWNMCFWEADTSWLGDICIVS